ncbi:hypothetical protein HN385_00565 [archaeon]|jgi:hypothetical protein|nr:hypothetical protein [archaeon]MBT3451584.1 hypothetical protein [archaeon]MBT6869604.1 hypothetical protein [archaeon]MBT7192373.1 hypothetical protein [archaeon]MBT7380174.1 hypothetical protein [archaeon]
MVKKKEKARALEFICDQLEDSIFTIDDTYEYGVEFHCQMQDNSRRDIDLVFANLLPNQSTYLDLLQDNTRKGIYTAAIFYKDGKSAFARLVDRNPAWRGEKSLKRYTSQQINQMLHLRGMEKKVLGSHGNERFTFYQPQTVRLIESIRQFNLGDVWLDYSHIDEDDRKFDFVENRKAIDYKLPEELSLIDPSASVEFSRTRRLRAYLIPHIGGIR